MIANGKQFHNNRASLIPLRGLLVILVHLGIFRNPRAFD
jgi:hypothetical protein